MDRSDMSPQASETGRLARLARRNISKRTTPAAEAGEESWKYYMPHTGSNGQEPATPPPISQIPGISKDSDLTGYLPPLTPKSKIVDTDSAYIRLAKEGGRRDLLDFKETPTLEPACPKAYPWPEWMTSEGEHEKMKTPPAPYRPSWAEHHDEPDWSEFPPQAEANAASYKHAPPFSLQDKYHQWQRDDGRTPPARMLSNARTRQSSSQTTTSKKSSASSSVPRVKASTKKAHRRQTSNNDSQPVDMQHLMSMGYQKDWVSSRQHELEQQRAKERADADQKKQLIHRASSLNSNRASRHSSSNDDRSVFKLSRFSNVPSKVSTWREDQSETPGAMMG